MLNPFVFSLQPVRFISAGHDHYVLLFEANGVCHGSRLFSSRALMPELLARLRYCPDPWHTSALRRFTSPPSGTLSNPPDPAALEFCRSLRASMKLCPA